MSKKELIPPEPSREIYSKLLTEAIRQWRQSPEPNIRVSHPGSDDTLDQYVLAEGDNPKTAQRLTVGICMNTRDAYFKYTQQFRDGFVEGYGKIITIQHRFESGNAHEARQNRGKYKKGPIFRQLSPISAQTVANEFGVTVLDTLEVDLTDSGEIRNLLALGYSRRRGYSVFQKIYIPG